MKISIWSYFIYSFLINFYLYEPWLRVPPIISRD